MGRINSPALLGMNGRKSRHAKGRRQQKSSRQRFFHKPALLKSGIILCVEFTLILVYYQEEFNKASPTGKEMTR
jgi:hypothetical protein